MDIAIKWEKFWQSFWVQEGYRRVFSDGLTNTLIIAVSGLLIGILIGTLIASVKVMPKYKVLPRVLDGICNVYVGFFRGTPIVVQLLLSYYVICPLMGIKLGSLNTCVLVFGLNSGAYVSEIMRAGIQSVDPGQMEAGRALGLPYAATMIKIIVPQAVKNILPTLGNEFIALVNECAKHGVEPQKQSRGNFALRLDPEVYHRASIAAAAEGKSLNAFIADTVKQAVAQQ